MSAMPESAGDREEVQLLAVAVERDRSRRCPAPDPLHHLLTDDPSDVPRQHRATERRGERVELREVARHPLCAHPRRVLGLEEDRALERLARLTREREPELAVGVGERARRLERQSEPADDASAGNERKREPRRVRRLGSTCADTDGRARRATRGRRSCCGERRRSAAGRRRGRTAATRRASRPDSRPRTTSSSSCGPLSRTTAPADAPRLRNASRRARLGDGDGLERRSERAGDVEQAPRLLGVPRSGSLRDAAFGVTEREPRLVGEPAGEDDRRTAKASG